MKHPILVSTKPAAGHFDLIGGVDFLQAVEVAAGVERRSTNEAQGLIADFLATLCVAPDRARIFAGRFGCFISEGSSGQLVHLIGATP